jgi:hypothetical protein
MSGLSLIKKFFYAIIASFLLIVFFSNALANKEALPEFLHSFALRLEFKNSELLFDAGLPFPIFNSIEEPNQLLPGNYRIEIYSTANQLLHKSPYQPVEGKNIVFIPYFLNATAIKIVNPSDQIYRQELNDLTICNENNICEERERNLCPLDCQAANNPFYPLTPASQKIQAVNFPLKTLEPPQKPTATFTPKISKIYLTNYLIFLAASIGFLIIIFIALKWYNKNK